MIRNKNRIKGEMGIKRQKKAIETDEKTRQEKELGQKNGKGEKREREEGQNRGRGRERRDSMGETK